MVSKINTCSPLTQRRPVLTCRDTPLSSNCSHQAPAGNSTLATIRLAFNLPKDYTICMVYSGGTRSRFTVVDSIKIRTLDRITNIDVNILIWHVLRAVIKVCHVSIVFHCMLSGVGVAGRLHCIVHGVRGVGCIINLRLRYRWVWSLRVNFFSPFFFLVAGVVEHLVWTGSSQVVPLCVSNNC